MSERTLLVCLLAGALLAQGCAEAEEAPRLTAEVTRGPLVFEASYHGELQARTTVDIHAPDVPAIYFLTVDTVLDDGTEVKQGDTVLTFDRGPVEDDLRDRRAEHAVAEAELRRVEQELDKERTDLELEVKRREKALERARLAVVEGVNLISKLELEKARLDVKRAELELELARQALRAFARKREAAVEVQRLKVQAAHEKVTETEQGVAAMEVKSPANGVVYGPYVRLNWVRSKVVPGKVVRPGDKLLEIPDLSTFDARIYVRQRDGTLLSEGDEVTIYPTARPDHPIRGRISKKETYATTRNERLGTDTPEGNLKEVLIVVALEETLPELRPGGTIRADLRATLVKDAVLAPLAALKPGKDGHTAVMADGSERKVKVGKTSITHAEVLEGLSAGDRVVVE